MNSRTEDSKARGPATDRPEVRVLTLTFAFTVAVVRTRRAASFATPCHHRGAAI